MHSDTLEKHILSCPMMLANVSLPSTYLCDCDTGEAPWVKEEPEGTFQELLAGGTYYCIIIENPEQYKRDMAEVAKKMEGVSKDTEVKPRQEVCMVKEATESMW